VLRESSVETLDPIYILHSAVNYMKAQGKNITDDNDLFELQTHMSLFMSNER
jgi:hypothetical protein